MNHIEESYCTGFFFGGGWYPIDYRSWLHTTLFLETFFKDEPRGICEDVHLTFPLGEKLHWAFTPLREGLANAQRVTPGSGWADQSS